MNLEKLKAYNQKLLAILGTIVALMAAIGLVMLIFFVITEIIRVTRNIKEDSGILSDKKIEKLLKENKRQQLVSYDFPQLVDTINVIYMIPVSHKTLNAPEEIDPGVFGLVDSRGSQKSIDTRYSRRYYGSFNNLLIFDPDKKNIKKLFTDRVNFNLIDVKYTDDDILILITASDTDTYKDGVINLNDLKSLYIYSLKEQKLRQVNCENSDIANYDLIEGTKDLIVQFGLDRNEDGKFDDYNEPTIIRKYDFKNEELIKIVDAETHNLLQKTLEGTKK